MIEISDTIRKKLNDPKIIKGIAEYILVNFGCSSHHVDANSDKSGVYNHISYDFVDFSGMPLLIRGRLDLEYSGKEQNWNREVYEFFQNISEGQSVYSLTTSYNFFMSKLEKQNFQFIRIALKDLSSGEYNTVFREDNFDIGSFKKGPWQQRLAEIYLKSLELRKSKKSLL